MEQKERKRERTKEYCLKNKEKISQYKNKYYKKNKEKILKQQKEYRFKNNGKIKQYHKEYNLENKEKINQMMKKHNKIKKDKFIEKLGGKCIRCGESDPIVLELHHIEGAKERTIKTLETEIEKGLIELLCANCHLWEHEKLKTTQTLKYVGCLT